MYGKNKKLASSIHRVALRKLWQIDNAEVLRDLKVPPSNRLEALKRDRLGQYSITNGEFALNGRTCKQKM